MTKHQAMRRQEAEEFLRAIPADELPNVADRAALVAALVAGDVEDVYRPFGDRAHNVTLPVPAWVDPRMRLSDWVELRHSHSAGDIPALLIATARGHALNSVDRLRGE